MTKVVMYNTLYMTLYVFHKQWSCFHILGFHNKEAT